MNVQPITPKNSASCKRIGCFFFDCFSFNRPKKNIDNLKTFDVQISANVTIIRFQLLASPQNDFLLKKYNIATPICV